MKRTALVLAFVGCLIGCSTSFAGVVVVDPGSSPGGPILQSSIDAAQSGDILLVRAGNYVQAGVLTIDSRSLTLIRDSSSDITLPQVRVSNTSPSSAVVIRGFRIGAGNASTAPGKPGVEVASNPGTVWLEDCVIQGGVGFEAFAVTKPGAGIAASESPGLVVERCQITGGKGLNPEFGSETVDGAPGIVLENSKLSMHDSIVSGGAPGFGTSKPATHEGAGLILKQSRALAAGCTITGGATFVAGAVSEPGVEVFDNASLLFLRHCQVAGGAAPNGIVAPAEVGPSGTIVHLAQPTTSLSVTSPHRPNETATIEMKGTPGDLCALFTGGFGPISFLAFSAQGTYVLGVPSLGPFALAPIPQAGTLSFGFQAVPLPPGIAGGFTVALQGTILSPSGTLEAASTFVEVDTGY